MFWSSHGGSFILLNFFILPLLPQEYNVRASTSNDKSFYIGRFVTGLPPFSRKKSAENKWTLQKEGLQGRQMTDGLKV